MTAADRKTPRNCTECHREFVPPLKRGPVPTRCDGCKSSRSPQYKAARATARKDALRNRRADVVCLTCGCSLSERRATKYCSKRCFDIARGFVRAAPLPERACALEDCGVVFVPTSAIQRCCCEKHGKLHCNREGRASGKYLPTPWNDARRESYQRRRAQKKATSTGERVVWSDIVERDGSKCGLCAGAVDLEVKWPDPLSPSLDHVIPLSKGGAHDPSNVQLAHLRCNVSKGNRVEVSA